MEPEKINESNQEYNADSDYQDDNDEGIGLEEEFLERVINDMAIVYFGGVSEDILLPRRSIQEVRNRNAEDENYEPMEDSDDTDSEEVQPAWGESGDLAPLRPEHPIEVINRRRSRCFKKRSKRTRTHEQIKDMANLKRSRSKHDTAERSRSPSRKRMRLSPTQRSFEI